MVIQTLTNVITKKGDIMQIKELDRDEMTQVNGGSISSSVINAIANVINIVLELGEKTGSSIRRMISGDICQAR